MTDIEILSQLQILLQVTIAIILGGIIGFERERREKPAGFRTNMVVGGASALFIILGRYIVTALQQDLPPDALGVDPTRILYAVIFGVSFIGAGTIIKDGPSGSIENLTTAATILMSAAVGICIALNLYVLAVGVTVLTVLINTVVRKIYG